MLSMMDMCREMLGAMRATRDMAVFDTPELRRIFNEWLAMLEEAALKALGEHDDMPAANLPLRLT